MLGKKNKKEKGTSKRKPRWKKSEETENNAKDYKDKKLRKSDMKNRSCNEKKRKNKD